MISEFHVAGHCVICTARCFEVLAVHEEHERLPGEPKRLGPPEPGAVRITFLLLDGTRAMLTFCAECAENPITEHYELIWRKVLRCWIRELSEKPDDERNPDWFTPQFANGLLCEQGRQPWTEAWKNG
jgi:hypothetical protein